MHFFKLVVTALLPLTPLVSAIAAPSPAANQAAGRVLTSVERAYVDSLLNVKRDAGEDRPLVESRQDLTSALGQLLSLISEIGQFLTPEFLNDTYSVVVNLADLLDDPFVSDTRGIITSASGLLGSLAPLLDQISSIDLGGIISAVSPLLTSDSINGISTLLTNAENLLTANFVSEITGLINDVAPVCHLLEPPCAALPQITDEKDLVSSLCLLLHSSLLLFSALCWGDEGSALPTNIAMDDERKIAAWPGFNAC